MKLIGIICISLLLLSSKGYSQKFMRNLPGEEILSQLTPEKFKDMNAVIVLKEQSYKVEEMSASIYGTTFSGNSSQDINIMMIKLLNESAVTRYGTFEFSYGEQFGNDLPNNFILRIRVLKPNGKVNVIKDDQIERIVSVKSSSGEPAVRKVLCKIPDLAPGDVLHWEYEFTRVFARALSRIFYFSDREYVLFSNLYITLPSDQKADFHSVPEQRVGKPTIEKLTTNNMTGETYFWSVKNISPIPTENFGFPFADQSMITAFVLKGQQDDASYSWDKAAKDYYKINFENGDILESKDYNNLNIVKKKSVITFETIDSLYAHLRTNFKLISSSNLYPNSGDIAKIISEKRGDASDLAYIFFRVLQDWGVTRDILWLRDKRLGTYEQAIPTTAWFDRLGIRVNLNAINKVYDFDESAPIKQYVEPWYLKGIQAVKITSESATHIKLPDVKATEKHNFIEKIELEIAPDLSVKSKIEIKLNGYYADRLRSRLSNNKQEDIKKHINDTYDNLLMVGHDSLTYSDLFDYPQIVINGRGDYYLKAEELDKYVTLRLQNQAFDNFTSALETTRRRTPVNIQAPLQFFVTWEVKIPIGFVFKSGPENAQSQGPMKSVFMLNVTPQEDHVKISANIQFKETVLSAQDFPQLMNFLTEIQTKLKADLVFEKK